MSKLSPEAEAILASARKDLRASEETVARVKAAVQARIEGTPPGSDVTLHGVSPMTLLRGAMLVVAVAGLIGGTLVSWEVPGSSSDVRAAAPAVLGGSRSSTASDLGASCESRPSERPDSTRGESALEAKNVGAVPSLPVAALPDRSVVRPRGERGVAGSSERQRRVAAQLASATATSPATENLTATDALLEETRLLRAAQLGLEARLPEAARQALDEHAARFPLGALREERLTLRVLLLCQTGDVAEARRARAELDRAFPTAFHASRLSTSCASEDPSNSERRR